MKSKQQKPDEQAQSKRGEMQFREAAFEVLDTRKSGESGNEGGEISVSMSVSSEAPVMTYAYYNGQYQRVFEILDHGSGSIDMSRCKDGLVILDRHYGDQIGLMACSVTDRKLGGPVEFCTGDRAQEIRADAVKKLRRNTSVGYRVDSEKYVLEGEKDGIPVVRAMSWMPYEASFEPVPADTRVGVGRSENEVNNNNRAATAAPKETNKMEPKDMAALFTRGAKYGIDAEKVQALIDDGKGRAELDALIVEKQTEEVAARKQEIEELRKNPPKPARPAAIEAAQIAAPAIVKNDRKYSLMGVVRALAGEQVDIGFERELSQECGRRRGKASNGLIVPFNALSTRTLSVAGTSSATVETMLDAANFIDLLRTKYVLGLAGVTFIPGASGNFSLPKMSAGATSYHVAEAGDLTASTPTLANVTGTPHTIGAIVDVTRRMIEQSTPAVEAMVSNEIQNRLMRGVQIAVFAGTGADGQPSAITTATGITDVSVTTGTPTYAELLNFPGSIMAANADANGQKWIGTAEVWAKLAATATNGAGSPLALDVNTNKLIGRDFLTTEDVPANSLWFGDWSSVVIPFWGAGVELASDSAKLFASGGLTLRAMLDYDVMVRQGAALAYDLGVTS